MPEERDESGVTGPDRLPAALEVFSLCHAGIADLFIRVGRLSRALRSAAPDPAQREEARELRVALDEAILEHHAEEERELFPVLQENATGPHAQDVAPMLARLVDEHRALERDWSAVSAQLQQIASGERVRLDAEAAERLFIAYFAHAEFEEEAVLPLAARLLGPRKSEALGWSMARRHALGRAFGYT
ncbi:MAG TPA: hemerythrin domain-containing protein [Burkholderiaceae bacterium]|nr:hemerythrin domain-containing protein [Burkholderiaceae bacterium]